MLKRINELMEDSADFAFETTLSTRSYVSFIGKARDLGYNVTLLFFWLDSPETARKRVMDRVSEGGHNIPPDVIDRRYYRGWSNLFELYLDHCDKWTVVNNTNVVSEVIAEGMNNNIELIFNNYIWGRIFKRKQHDNQRS